MIRFFSFVLGSLVLASGTALCAEFTKGNISIDDKSLKDVPEPIKCYSFLGDIAGDAEMPVGLAVQLCAGTKNAKATLVCYKMAFEALKLNRGLAIELCSEGRPNLARVGWVERSETQQLAVAVCRRPRITQQAQNFSVNGVTL